MKRFFSSLAMTFSMFSVLPMPQVKWEKDNMRYLLGNLPLVGLVIGLVLWAWFLLCAWLNLGDFFFAVGLTLLPVWLSGGIHLDGYCDTADALASHASPERKREILKDSHVGAFALLAIVLWFLLYLGFCTELNRVVEGVWALGVIQILSRALGSLASLLFPSPKQPGALASFRSAANHQGAVVVLLLWVALCFALLCFLSPWGAGTVLLLALFCLIHVYRLAKKEFLGMSGDLTGYLISLSQLWLGLGYVLAERVVAVCC